MGGQPFINQHQKFMKSSYDNIFLKILCTKKMLL